MWICITHVSAAPIIRCAIDGRMTRSENTGTASKNPRKNTTAAGSTYDGFVMWVENCSTHGTVMNQPQISHRGAHGTRFDAYHASAASDANESRFSRTNADSGTGTIRSGVLIRTPCSAP